MTKREEDDIISNEISHKNSIINTHTRTACKKILKNINSVGFFPWLQDFGGLFLSKENVCVLVFSTISIYTFIIRKD